MKKMVVILIISLVSMSFVSIVNLAAERELIDEEKAAFITRKEFNTWQTQFIASLSELDMQSTSKIYDDMNFYDMQYRFTEKYKQEEYWDDENQRPKPKLEQMILAEKAKRGIL